jgi:CHAD domain-containing protein
MIYFQVAMASSNRLGTAVRGRLDALVRDLPLARAGQPEALHRTRVASRRIRAALPFLAEEVPRARLEKAAKRTRRITRALGSVRELDVALQTLDEFEAAGPEHRAALELVRQAIAGRRGAMRARLMNRLGEIKPERMIQKLTDRLDGRNGRAPGREWRGELARAVDLRTRRLRKAIQHAGSLYLPDRLHAVRVGLKKLRYTLELAHETGAASTKTLLGVLKQGQETLGRVHDIEVFLHFVRSVRTGAEGRGRDVAHHLDTLTASLERECRTMHGRYSSMQPRLLAVCDRTIDQIVPRVQRARPAAGGSTGRSAGRDTGGHGATDRAVPDQTRRRRRAR